MKRNEQKIENTWDLTIIYKSEDLLEKDLEICFQIVNKIENNKGSLFESKESFSSFLKGLFEFELLMTKAYTYAHHKLDEQLTDAHNQKLFNNTYAKYIDFSQRLTFITNEILENEQKIKEYLLDEKFNDLQKYFDDIFRFAKYTLTDKEERILALSISMASTPNKAYSSLIDSEFVYDDIVVDGKTLKLTQGTYNNYITSPNRKIREQAFKNLYKPFEKHINTLSILYNGQINVEKFTTKARGYDSNIKRALFANNIDLKVYENLVSAVNENININHDYVSLRKQKLGLEEMNLYDMYVPLIHNLDKEINFDEAKQIITNCFEILGDDYVFGLEQAFSNRWIDIYENESKRSGAYSGGMYSSPPYILLNYTNKINDLYTLAHELGHSMHTFFTNSSQKFYNSHYRIFIAEVASIVNELLLTDYLLKTNSNQEYQAYILNYLLEQFRTTLIRQTMFCEFEMITHSKVEQTQDLTKEEFNDIYYNLNKNYFGKDVIIDEEIKYEWARIPHFYYNFYVYQYATSFCAAIKIKNNIKKDPTFVNKYLEFLKIGDSVYPLDALKNLGIDLTKKEVVEEAMYTYGEVLNKFKEINV